MGPSTAHGDTLRLKGIVLRHEGLDRVVEVGGDPASRAALGLPIDRPIIATGHQGGLHHGGLIAKDMAVRALAQRHAGAAVHLLLDIGNPSDTETAVPVLIDGTLQVQQGPAFNDIAPLDGMREQWAMFGLEPVVIRASDLLRTPAGQGMLDAMRSAPQQCTQALAEAIAAVPGSQLRPPQGDELPLWVSDLDQSDSRRIANAGDLDRSDVLLQPRAVLTTALMRMAVCDLFIHGTGGAMYDQVTDRWLQAWLDRTPPPFAMVTADVVLDHAALARAVVAVEQARAQVRRARHDSGDPAVKQRLVAEIKALPRGSVERTHAFDRMHLQLEQASADAVQAAEQCLAEARAKHDVLARRDYPLVALPEGVRAAFAEACAAAFG